jgi:RsiW-degrading membrane proteinase PrsW (M82 family)
MPGKPDLTFYQTIFLSFLIGLALIWIAGRFWQTDKYWQQPLFILAGGAMIALILWLLLQILIGLPSLDQVVDLPAISLGILIAYGFQNAVTAIKTRAKNKFK